MLTAPQIRCIEKASVHNICSGQVIVTLATAVKELAENSIDAGAKSIHITFRDYGLKAVEVSDNGGGIIEENFAGLTLKHHTSKIREFEDISDVSTFGFRGEALSSLCALGDLSILTSTGGLGTHVTYDKDGKIIKMNAQARPQGTTVIIESLFHTLPVRHKEFTKNIKKEFHKAIDALQAYAMVSLNIRIHCLNIINKRKQVIFSTQGKSTLRDNIVDVLGSSVFKNLVTVNFNDSIFNIHGYISKPLPKHGRGSADKQYLFINGRPCDHDKLCKMVNSAFKTYEKFQYPIFVLVIDIARESIDVNVTPDKRKLFVDNENKLIEGLSNYLGGVFQKFAGVYIDQCSKIQLTLPNTELCSQVGQQSYLTKEIDRSRGAEVSASGFKSIASKTIPSGTKQNEAFIEEQVSLYTVQSTSPCSESNDINSESEHIISIEVFEPDIAEESDIVNDFKMEIIESLPSKEKRQSIVPAHHSSNMNSNTQITSTSPESLERTQVDLYDKPLMSHKRRQVSFQCSLSLIKEQCRCVQQHKSCADRDSIHFKHQIVSSEDAEKELNRQISKEMFRKMKILGQFNLGFILVKHIGNLFIIDQHATDEKFRYETLRKETKIENQKLICPKPMALNGAQEDLLMSYKSIFVKNGFEFIYDETREPGNRVFLTALPRSKYLVFEEEDAQELLWLLSEESKINIENLRPSKVHRMFASRACRSAVMIGTALDKGEMRKIVDHMAEMEHPWNCPHGRPTMRHVVDLTRIS